jgi:hypothetical protein
LTPSEILPIININTPGEGKCRKTINMSNQSKKPD